MRTARLAFIVALLPLAGCTDDGPEPARTAAVERSAEARIDIDRSRFSQEEIVVTAGTTVTFSNTDAFAHTVTAAEDSPMPFDSGELLQGDTYRVTFGLPGEYRYYCGIHPTMRATVVVT